MKAAPRNKIASALFKNRQYYVQVFTSWQYSLVSVDAALLLVTRVWEFRDEQSMIESE